MNFAILTINFQRPNIFQLFCASISRLRSEIGFYFPVIVVSGYEDKTICDKHNIYHIEYPNSNVLEKWNVGAEFIKTLGVDYMVVSGSDDIFSTVALSSLIKEMDKDIDLIGFNKIYVYDTDGVNRGQLLCVTSKGMLGVGKTVHRRVLDSVFWRPWEYPIIRRWGMDMIFYKNISPHVKTKSIIDGIIVDCKNKDSLNKFSMFKKNYHGKLVDSNIFYNFISKQELDILRGIQNVGLPLKFPRVHKRGRTLI